MYATRSVATTRRRARSSLSAVRSASIAASAPFERRCAAFAFSAASVVVSGLPSSPSSDLSRAMSDERSADASTRSARVARASSSSACRCASSASPSPPSASSAGRGAGGASSASRNSSRSESSSSAARRRRTSRWSFISRNASILSESARWRGTSRCACGSFDFCSTGSSSARPSCFISSRRSGISFSSFATASFCDFTACSRKPFTPDEIASSAAARSASGSPHENHSVSSVSFEFSCAAPERKTWPASDDLVAVLWRRGILNCVLCECLRCAEARRN